MTNLNEDFSTLAGDASGFSDVTSDDSSGWMHKIDVSNFKELTSSGVHAEYFISTNHPQTIINPNSLKIESNSCLNLDKPAPKRARLEDQESSYHQLSPTVSSSTRSYPKPLYSYSCLIALALKNSKSGRLQVSEIYSFMCENFPYFRSAPPGWKNSVRHNLSLNKCFEKIVVETAGGHGRKCCLWMLNPNKVAKMEQEIKKWREKDPSGVREALRNPDDLDIIEMGLKGLPGDHRQIVVQTLPDLVPLVHSNFLQTTAAACQNPPRSWYYSSSCLTPPRPSSYEYHSLGPPVCQPQICSPAAFSTPIRRPSASNSPLSVTSTYSPKSNWLSDSGQKVPCSMQMYSSLGKTGYPSLNSNIGEGFETLGPASPWKSLTSVDCQAPYQTALAATNANNSLLQTALSMSPCYPSSVTLQSL